MMRDVCVRAVEAGLHVCCPVHDAFLIEAKTEEIDDAVATLKRLMGDASERVLGPGRLIDAEADVYRWPNRYFEGRGRKLFETVIEAVEGGKKARTAVICKPRVPPWFLQGRTLQEAGTYLPFCRVP